MSFDWREYLNLALLIPGHGGKSFTREAAHRTSVSRAYYAAFCHARNYARDKQGFIPTHSARDHEFVREHFQRQGMTDVADNLDDLRKWRNKCDYDDSIYDPYKLLTSSIVQCREIINRLALP